MQTAIEKLHPSVNLRLGGAGNKALYILYEYADYFLHVVRGIKMWDTCAAEALLRGRFGIVTDKDK